MYVLCYSYYVIPFLPHHINIYHNHITQYMLKVKKIINKTVSNNQFITKSNLVIE